MADPAKNFAKTTVSAGYAAGITSIALTGGDGAKLPDPGVSGEFNLVWWNSTDYSNPSDDPNVEIVRCTARTTDALTVTRAQEGTTDVNHNTGGKSYKMILTFTQKAYDDKASLSGATFTGNINLSDNNITNVGNISLNTISSNAGTTVSVILGTDAGDNFIVGNNNALVVEGDTDRVGMGTSDPQKQLEISGLGNVARLRLKRTDGGNVGFEMLGSDSLGWALQRSGTTFAIAKTYDGTALFTIADGGNVGINEPDPDAMLEIVTNATTEEGLKIKGSASQTGDLIIATDSSDNIGFSVQADFNVLIRKNGIGDIAVPSSGENHGILLENNTEVSSAVRETAPYIVLKGHGWTGSADQITEHALFSDASTNGNPSFKIFAREGGSGGWSQILNIDSYGQWGTNFKRNSYNQQESVSSSFYGINLGNDAGATASYDQFPPFYHTDSAVWNTNGGGSSQRVSVDMRLMPEAGDPPTTILKFFLGYNSTVADKELLKLSWNGTDKSILLDANTTIGSGEAGVDYTLTFDGETNDGVLLWDEDNAIFNFDNPLIIQNIKSGATQGGAGATANELWKTASHATLPDNVILIGV